MPVVADHTSKRERIAMEAERELVELKKLQFMQDKVGEEFDGYITGVSNFGFFVELSEFFVEGLVHITRLADDFYQYLEKQHSLQGRRSRVVYRIGDKVKVRIDSVSLERRQIDFSLAGSPQSSRQSPESEDYRPVPVKGKKPAGFHAAKGGVKAGKVVTGRSTSGKKRRR